MSEFSNLESNVTENTHVVVEPPIAVHETRVLEPVFVEPPINVQENYVLEQPIAFQENHVLEPVVAIQENISINVGNSNIENVEIINSEKTFIELIKLYFDNEEFKKKLSFEISKDTVNIINHIISLTPYTFSDVERSVSDIIKDNKVDSKDVPQFIVIIQTIYLIIYDIRKDNVYTADYKKRAEFTCNVLKFLVHVLVLEGKVKVHENSQCELLNNINMLIDSCVNLLIFNKIIKTPGCLEKFLNKFSIKM